MVATEECIYLDCNATTPLRPEAQQAMQVVLDECGNPSSVHSVGRRARAHLSGARSTLAELFGVDASRVIFTSGCTEANMHVLTPFYRIEADYERLAHVLVGATEHPSVLKGGRFSDSEREVLPVDSNGHVEVEPLRQSMERISSEGSKALVSIMAVNNETGIVQPMEEIAEIVNDFGGVLHVDATQIIGRRHVRLDSLGCDVMTLSAHKLGGPQGVGAVILAGEQLQPAPLVTGGGQEYYQRSGTENVAAVAGFGAVAEIIPDMVAEMKQIGVLRDKLEEELRTLTPDIVIFGESVDRIENTSCYAVPNISAETAVIACDLEGIAISSGSACSSGRVDASHVLEAMGVPKELAQGALRISLGWKNTKEEINRFLQKWRSIVDRVKPHTIGNAA